MSEEAAQQTWPSEVRQRPCPFCGENVYLWGFFAPGSFSQTFKSAEDSWWVRNSGWGGTGVDARACKA